MAALRKVDHSGLRTGQAITIAALLVAFIFNSWLLVAFVAIAQLLAGVDSPYAPYRLIYQQIVKPSGLVKPNVISDNPEPHRFAMLLGGIMNSAATILLLTGGSTPAWVLVWIVIALANLNFWLNFCLGCLMYYQLNRLHVPGFTQAPITEQRMIERLLVALVLLVGGVIAYRTLIAYQIRRTTALAPSDPLLSGIKRGVATILYFTTPTCAPCKTQQMPALNRLQAELGEAVQIVQVDASEQPDAAQRWGVLSVPTTFVIDATGATLAVNHGVAETEKLRHQLEAA